MAPPAKRGVSGKGKESTTKKAKGPQSTSQMSTMVSKAVYDNFRNWEHELVYVKKVDGKTLVEHIAAEKEAQLAEQRPMSPHFYMKLKGMFRAETDPLKALKATNKDLKVDSQLLQAMIMTKKARPCRSGMQQFFCTSTVGPNQTEIVGILKFFCSLKPGCTQQLIIGLDCLRYCAKYEVPRHYQDEWQLVFNHGDKMVLQAWKKAKYDEKMEAKVFCQLHGPILEMFVPKNAAMAVLQCTGDRILVKDELREVVASSEIGMSLFGFGLGRVLASEVKGKIEMAVKSFAQHPMTDASLTRGKKEATDAVEKISNIELLPKLREITASYRGLEISHNIHHISEEVSFRFACKVKECAVDKGLLKPMIYEDLVVAENRPAVSVDVSESLYLAADIARESARKAIIASGAATGDVLKKLCEEKEQVWMGLERDFGVEMGVLASVTGAGAGQRLKAKILEGMASFSKATTPSDTLQLLTRLVQSDLYKLADSVQQGKVNFMHKIIGRLVDHRPPALAAACDDELLSDCVARIPFYLRAQKVATNTKNDDKGVTVFGAEALAALYPAAKEAADKGKATLEDSWPFKVYMYLAEGEAAKNYQALVDLVEKSVGALTAKRRATSKISAKGSAPGPSDDAAVAAAMAMFD